MHDPAANNSRKNHFRLQVIDIDAHLMEFPKLPQRVSYQDAEGPIEVTVVQLLPDFDGNFDDNFGFDEDVSYNAQEYRKLSNSFMTNEESFIDDFMQDRSVLSSLGIAPSLVQRIRSDSIGKSDSLRKQRDQENSTEFDVDSSPVLMGRSSPRLSLSEDGFILLKNYKISPDTLGGGKLSEVRLAYGEKDHNQYAVKIQCKTKLENAKLLLRTSRNPLEEVRREINILKRLHGHKNIIRLMDVIDEEDDDNLYLVFERLDRELMTIPSDKPYCENEARRFFQDIINGVEYMHSHKIAHRDLKPENMLLDRDGVVKIADFGFCDELTSLDNGTELVTSNSQAGTPAFFAPECLSANSKQLSGKALDMWSLGITLYSLVIGDVPFKGESMPQLFQAILNDEVQFPDHILITNSLCSLISGLLVKDPSQRCNMEDVKNHPWMKELDSSPT